MNFHYHWPIQGHEKKIKELENDILSKNISHAYLFSGPENTGKFCLAKNFAQILQCPQNHCRKCHSCLHIERGWHIDTVEISDNGNSLKIEEIRDLLEKVNLSTQSPFKIVLIQNIERLTLEAANALLKTLEEPPKGVVFLLTTNNVKEILATIVSRVRLFKFSTFSDATLKNILQKSYPLVSEQELETVCILAGGKSGKAFSFLENPDYFQQYKIMYEKLRTFLSGTPKVDTFSYMNEIIKENHQIKDFLEVFLATLRYDTLVALAAKNNENIPKYIDLMKKIQQTKSDLKRNINARLALENLMLTL